MVSLVHNEEEINWMSRSSRNKSESQMSQERENRTKREKKENLCLLNTTLKNEYICLSVQNQCQMNPELDN